MPDFEYLQRRLAPMESYLTANEQAEYVTAFWIRLVKNNSLQEAKYVFDKYNHEIAVGLKLRESEKARRLARKRPFDRVHQKLAELEEAVNVLK